jgi:hypothetical protein
VIKLRFDEGPQCSRLVLASDLICPMSSFSLAAIPAARSSIDLDSFVKALAKPTNLPFNAVPWPAKGRHCELLKGFERMIEFLPQATSLVPLWRHARYWFPLA